MRILFITCAAVAEAFVAGAPRRGRPPPAGIPGAFRSPGAIVSSGLGSAGRRTSATRCLRFRGATAAPYPPHLRLGPAVRPLFSSARGNREDRGDNDDNDGGRATEISTETQRRRTNALRDALRARGIDADALADADVRAGATTDGFDNRFGASAIRAYRTYIRPTKRKSITAAASEDPAVAAARTANQIDFLARHHRSREAEWVRHTDEDDAEEEEGGGRRRKREAFPLRVVLDNVRSAANVGSIFRTADACNCAEVITTGITPHPGGGGAEKLSRTALGADRTVPSRHFDSTRGAIEALRAELGPGLCTVGMETTERSRCYADVVYPGLGGDSDGGGGTTRSPGGSVALVLGNEVTGVDVEVLSLMDEVVEVPMFGTKNSLNVAAALPIVMYEVLRQWGVVGGGGAPGEETLSSSSEAEDDRRNHSSAAGGR